MQECDPEEALSLQQEHQEITPGYLVDERHWLTLHEVLGLSRARVAELVQGSCSLVAAGLPRHRRPPLPDGPGA